MSVFKLREEMSYEELAGWNAYFERRPIDWRADDRAFKLLQAQGVKEKPWAVFTSLQNIYNPPSSKDGTLSISNFRNSALFSQLLSAKGGDKGVLS